MPTPSLIKYWGGQFRLRKENLPEPVQKDMALQQKVLLLLAKQYAHKDWGKTLPADRFTEMNEFVYSLLESYF
jgi:hypothetical protein